jgi:hypothetical protein
VDTAKELLATALTISVQLGVPVAVIFLHAWRSRRARGQPQAFRVPRLGGGAVEPLTVAGAGEGKHSLRP